MTLYIAVTIHGCLIRTDTDLDRVKAVTVEYCRRLGVDPVWHQNLGETRWVAMQPDNHWHLAYIYQDRVKVDF